MKSLEKNDSGQSGIMFLFLILLILVIVLIGISVDAVILSKVMPKLNGTDAASNATMDTIKERAWNAVDLGAIGLPIMMGIGFVVFMILWVRQREAQL